MAPAVEKLPNSHQPLWRKPNKMEEVEAAGAAQAEREAPALRAGAKSDATALAEHATRTATELQLSATETAETLCNRATLCNRDLQRLSATETQAICSSVAPDGDLSDAKLLDTGSWHAALPLDASSRARTHGSTASAFAAPAAGLFYSTQFTCFASTKAQIQSGLFSSSHFEV
jgi:hypothetical protein